MRSILDEELESGFNADADLCKAYLAKMKLGPSHHPDDPVEDLEDVIYYAHQVEVRTESPVINVIEEVERLTTQHTSPWNSTVSKYGGFLGFVVNRNLVHYVKTRLKTSPKAVHGSHVPLLHLAIQHIEPSSSRQQYLNVDMVRLLLSVGADPNQGIIPTPAGWTVWREFISTLHEGRIRGETDSTTLRRTLELLLAHGADPAIESRIKRPGHQTSWNAKVHLTAAEILRAAVPNDAEWLLSKASKWNFSVGGIWSSWLTGKLLR
ncbi:hypothetical protein BDV96DRAFT_650058 [Lophiotrema nucula]|uniref:Ankyrin repeat-containing domain protein n=1 Tax=Lophiotrema nucula TaxID=690887 RepID=A0A6A5YZG3_9PLEO|nr:hypothetical protein BDV96DRAFT_650058 [Lophiotrema nucula]